MNLFMDPGQSVHNKGTQNSFPLLSRVLSRKGTNNSIAGRVNGHRAAARPRWGLRRRRKVQAMLGEIPCGVQGHSVGARPQWGLRRRRKRQGMLRCPWPSETFDFLLFVKNILFAKSCNVLKSPGLCAAVRFQKNQHGVWINLWILWKTSMKV